MILRSALAVLLLAMCNAAAANAESPAAPPTVGDWPHWAGPHGDCTSDETGLLREWPKDGPKVLWRIPVTAGSNHPSVAGDDLCYAQLEDNELKDNHKTETVKCIDANTGREKWSFSYEVPPIWHVGWGELGPRATPTITDKYVYAIGTFGNAYCFDRKTGAIIWKQDFRKQSPYLDGTLKGDGNLEWKGFNGSLIPIGDKIPYFYWQGGNPAIPAWAKTQVTGKMQFFAFDANTGNVAWKYEEDCAPGTRGPGLLVGSWMPIRFHNEDCLVIHGNRQWKILRLADGKQLWNWECTGPIEAPCWACGGLRKVGANLYLDSLNGWVPSVVECDFSQDDPKPKVLWSNVEIHDAVTPPVICDGCIYGFFIDDREDASSVSQRPGEIDFSLRCTDVKTGKVLWKEPGFHLGLAITAADGMLYVHDYERLTLVEASRTGYVQKGRIEKLHDIANTGKNSHRGLLDWSMPAISRGRLFVRTPVEIICYDIKAPPAANAKAPASESSAQSSSSASATPSVGWRNDGSGQFPLAAPPTEWSETKNVRWKTKIGPNKYSSPIVVNGKILLVADPALLFCVNAADGKILWQTSNGFADLPGNVKEKPLRDSAGNTTPTPVSDGQFVYAVFGSGIVACYDMDGRRKWIQYCDLKPATEYGRATSPVLVDGKLLVTLNYLIALDTRTGKQVWTNKDVPELYGTPLVTTLGGVDVLVMPSGQVVRVRDGVVLAANLGGLNFASPIIHDDTVYLIQTGSSAQKISAATPDKWEAKQMWDQELEGTFYASAIWDKGLIYAVSNENKFAIVDSNDGKVLTELDLDFDTSHIAPSLVMAGNRLFVFNDQGDALVLEPGRQYKQLIRNHLASGHASTPAFDGKYIYIRGGQYLYCVGEK